LKQLTDAGVRVFLYLEDRERTLDNAMDKVMLSLSNFASEMEREKAGQRTYDAMLRKAKAGYVTGGKVFGYQNLREDSHVKRVIDEAEAQTVRRIFTEYADGLGMLTIAHRLNADGVKPPRGRGWSPSGIREMLRRSLYRGEIVWNKSQKIVRGGTKAQRKREASEWLIQAAPALRIIPEELAARVTERLDRTAALYPRGRAGKLMSRPWSRDESDYLLTGFIQCASCGGAMGTITPRHGVGESRHPVPHYVCLNATRRGAAVCKNRVNIRNERLDKEILHSVCQALDPSILNAAVDLAVAELTQGVAEHQSRKAVVERELDEVQHRLDRLLDALGDASLPRDEVAGRLNAEKARKDALTAERDRLAGMLSVADLDAEKIKADLHVKVQDIVAVLGQERPQARQMLRKLLAGKIVLHPAGLAGKKDRGYCFEGTLTIDRLISGEVLNKVTPLGLVAPTGFATWWAHTSGSPSRAPPSGPRRPARPLTAEHLKRLRSGPCLVRHALDVTNCVLRGRWLIKVHPGI